MRILAAAAMLALLTAPARAQTIVEICSSHDAIAALLRLQFHERLAATGLSSDGRSDFFEIWVNEEGRFHLVSTPAKTQRSCIVGNGVNWTMIWGSPA